METGIETLFVDNDGPDSDKVTVVEGRALVIEAAVGVTGKVVIAYEVRTVSEVLKIVETSVVLKAEVKVKTFWDVRTCVVPDM